MKRRLGGYVPGQQQFDYPVHTIKVLEGNKTVTVAPGAQTGLFRSVGRMNPHAYRPNEFFSNNWVYEGLVSYGPNGAILPALAESWTETADGMVFKLRTGVKFHDGADWNCAAAKLNFDHVFAEPFRNTDWHGWYNLPLIFDGAECNADGDLVLKITGGEYSNMLQELTFIRPARMLSPASFMSSASDSWMTHNSCPTGWGSASTDSVTVTCAGIKAPIGTGPFKFVSRTADADGNDAEVVFHRHDAYWGGAPDIEELVVKGYATAADVAAALTAGTLDAVIGGGVLEPADLRTFQASSDFSSYMTPVLMHSVIIINSGKVPTRSLDLRKTIIHGVNKADIINKELSGNAKAVDRLFPETAPYSDVELTPRWDYDFEKAAMLNCVPVQEIADACTPHTLDFVILEGDAVHSAVEDDIARDLAKLGITLNKRFVDKPTFNEAMVTG